jgi:hypothetical protein
MKLAPVRIEHAHGDGVRRPVCAEHKRNRANGVVGVGCPTDVRVEKRS